MRAIVALVVLGGLASIGVIGGTQAESGLTPGTRVLLDAHNAYPYDVAHADRLPRALSTGIPIAIEQDLVWYRDLVLECRVCCIARAADDRPRTIARRVFFSTIRPIIEKALRENRRETWPVITLISTSRPTSRSTMRRCGRCWGATSRG